MTKTKWTYYVFVAPDGCDERYCGEAHTIREARRMARSGVGLERALWGTARAAGHCGGWYAPPPAATDCAADDIYEWAGSAGYIFRVAREGGAR